MSARSSRWPIAVVLLVSGLVAVAAYVWQEPDSERVLPRLGEQTAASLLGPKKPEPSAAERTKLRAKRLRELAASAELPETLGFRLGQTHRVEVEGWLTRFGPRCAADTRGRRLQCEHIDGLRAGWSPIESLTLSFNASDRLIAVDIEREPLDSTAAIELLYRRDTAMARSLGPPFRAYGELDAAWLGGAPARQTMREYAGRGFRAHLTATGFGPWRARVHERYGWTPPPEIALDP
jgi:hypothetical protein